MITQKDVEYVAALSKLELTEGEKESFTEQLGDILEYAKQLEELDTIAVLPTYHIMNVTNVMREDTVKPSLDREMVNANAPEAQEGYFKVPKIL